MERRLLGGSPGALLDVILRHQVGSCKTTCSSVDYPTMARPLRIEFFHAIYHITSRGNARQRIVKTDADLSCLAEGD